MSNNYKWALNEITFEVTGFFVGRWNAGHPQQAALYRFCSATPS
jgi:hypothetical protein